MNAKPHPPKTLATPRLVPDSVKLMDRQGMRTSRDVANVLVAIVKDVGRQVMTPQVGNTMCNGLGKMIRLKELEIRYGTKDEQGHQRLQLADG
jgi:hypothetical protein